MQPWSAASRWRHCSASPSRRTPRSTGSRWASGACVTSRSTTRRGGCVGCWGRECAVAECGVRSEDLTPLLRAGFISARAMMRAMNDLFRIDEDPATGVAELALNRPERMNALTFGFFASLREAVQALDDAGQT